METPPPNPFDPNNPSFQYLTGMMSSRQRSDAHAAGGCLVVFFAVAILVAVGVLLARF
jgi:hypothetical protein